MSVRTVYDHPVFSPTQLKPAPPLFDRFGQKLPALGDVLFMPLADLWRLQLGFTNLLCASMLPDTLDLDIPACMTTLDSWAKLVKTETDGNLHRFRRNPKDYNNSEAYFRALMMVTVIEQDFGVRYNRDAINTKEFKSSREGFIHGILTGDRTGICANMPVLYASIGRKLGYPIYLVQAKGHFLCRWHDAKSGERFNIDACGHGMTSFPDSYYHNWPHKITDAEVERGYYLKSLDPAEELGAFMLIRGHCLHDAGHLLDSIVAYSHAHRLMPTSPTTFGFLLAAMNEEIDVQRTGKLPMSYRDAEHWDKVELCRFTLNSNYTTRVAGVNIDETKQGRMIARNG